MPISHQVISGKSLLTTEWGRITADDLRAHLRYLLESPDVPRPVRELMDKRRVQDCPLDFLGSIDYANDLASAYRAVGINRIAMLATQDAIYGTCRQLQILLTSREMQVSVYRDAAAACASVGISLPVANAELADATSIPTAPSLEDAPVADIRVTPTLDATR